MLGIKFAQVQLGPKPILLQHLHNMVPPNYEDKLHIFQKSNSGSNNLQNCCWKKKIEKKSKIKEKKRKEKGPLCIHGPSATVAWPGPTPPSPTCSSSLVSPWPWPGARRRRCCRHVPPPVALVDKGERHPLPCISPGHSSSLSLSLALWSSRPRAPPPPRRRLRALRQSHEPPSCLGAAPSSCSSPSVIHPTRGALWRPHRADPLFGRRRKLVVDLLRYGFPEPRRPLAVFSVSPRTPLTPSLPR